MPNKQQAGVRTNGGLVHWRTYAPLGLNELSTGLVLWFFSNQYAKSLLSLVLGYPALWAEEISDSLYAKQRTFPVVHLRTSQGPLLKAQGHKLLPSNNTVYTENRLIDQITHKMWQIFCKEYL